MAKQEDHLVLLATSSIEAKCKSEILLQALGLSPKQYRIVVIDAENPKLISKYLKKETLDMRHHYIVNIKEGIKMMSQIKSIFGNKYPKLSATPFVQD